MRKSIYARNTKNLLLTCFLSLSFLLTSCGDNTDSPYNIEIPGVDGPKVQLLKDTVLISMVFENVNLQGGLRYNIPKYPKSYLEISPDLQSTGTLMAISVDLDDVFHDRLDDLDPQTLPGGRALPGVASGRLPAVAFTIEKFSNMSFYVGPKVFGVFVPASLGLQGSMVTARFYAGSDRVGNLSLVGEDENGEYSGVLLMLDMAGKFSEKNLKKIAKRY